MNGNEAKNVELTDDLLEQVSGGAIDKKYKVTCPVCGCIGKGLTSNAAMQMAEEHSNWHLTEWSRNADWDPSKQMELIHCRYQLDFD